VIPTVGITLGDPAGVGAEVILKSLARGDVRGACKPIVLGDVACVRETAARLGVKLDLPVVDEAALRDTPGGVLPLSTLSGRARRPGRPSLEGGRASYEYIAAAARLSTAGLIDAIVTAPINKALVTRAGHPISGHTELLRDLTGAREVRMMLAGDRLRVVLVTMHLALEAVPRTLTVGNVARTITIADEHLRRYHGLARPRIAVAGLNPHAGEGGLFGTEEATIIAPAIRRAYSGGARASGPYPADSLFVRAVEGEFDAVVAMYHDQGLIPLKLLHFRDGVNVTMGLPIVRTSPDHGTAYDIAAAGTADAGSMTAALLLASHMAGGRTDTRARRPARRAHSSGTRRRQAR
jgi:4-phospho-D-threonate 3-dehydrogenase / 4-phospho-D-erythronate 3-dehydrogenase